ncbi:MAG: hypothetical protein ACOCWG_05860, partial [bacterium]
MNNVIIVPKKKLPTSYLERQIFIDGYFQGHQPVILSEDNDNLKIYLQTPKARDFYIEDLSNGLKWWDSNITLMDIPFSFKMGQHGLITLLDSWSLLSWSRWLSSPANTQHKEIILLHLDDHQDLMSPKVGFNNGLYYDFITNKQINFNDQNSVINSILSGSIGIGSMITPLVYMVNKIHIFHWKQTINKQLKHGGYRLSKKFITEPILCDSTSRISIELLKENDINITNNSSYFLSSSIEEIIEKLPKNIPIFLHVDMDFFNNRYNGSSNWEENFDKHDPGIEEQQVIMRKFFETLSAYDLISRITNTAIAISPGFYPVEYWKLGMDSLIKEAIQH